MPTLQRFGTMSIRMYADDHNPPHFHIVGTDFQVLVKISDLTILAGVARRGHLAEALAWAEEHRDTLLQTWLELNARG